MRKTLIVSSSSNKDILQMFIDASERLTDKEAINAPHVVTR